MWAFFSNQLYYPNLQTDKMKLKLAIAGLFAAGFLAFVSGVFCNDCATTATAAVAPTATVGLTEDDPAQSTMVIKVTDLVNNERAAKKIKKQLMELEGVTAVSACTHSGMVTISYNKPQLGCCSRIHTQLQGSGVQYELVSNQEVPACNGHNNSGTTGTPSTGCNRGTSSTSNGAAAPATAPSCGQGTQGGARPACCQQRRNS